MSGSVKESVQRGRGGRGRGERTGGEDGGRGGGETEVDVEGAPPSAKDSLGVVYWLFSKVTHTMAQLPESETHYSQRPHIIPSSRGRSERQRTMKLKGVTKPLE